MDISYSVVDAVGWQHLDTFHVAWPNMGNSKKTEMWANAQRDGRPAEYRWRPLFNAVTFG